ncbi:MAG: hypothetical protein M5R36_19310 [Deltaproteobacteria bacterium]|nr:hypothetical protein [Deltaproteobacteria bacterium]
MTFKRMMALSAVTLFCSPVVRRTSASPRCRRCRRRTSQRYATGKEVERQAGAEGYRIVYETKADPLTVKEYYVDQLEKLKWITTGRGEETDGAAELLYYRKSGRLLMISFRWTDDKDGCRYTVAESRRDRAPGNLPINRSRPNHDGA